MLMCLFVKFIQNTYFVLIFHSHFGSFFYIYIYIYMHTNIYNIYVSDKKLSLKESPFNSYKSSIHCAM